MKKMKTLLVGVVTGLVLTAPAWASPQTVTLNVSGMTCPACPITVKKALEKVPGVSKIEVQGTGKSACATGVWAAGQLSHPGNKVAVVQGKMER